MENKKKYSRLQTIIKDLQRVVVAFSGGVDSTFLLKVCVDVLGRENVLAFIGLSPTCPEREIAEARRLSVLIGVECVTAETTEMDDPRFIENNTSRCYFCKTHLFAKAREIAVQRGFSHVVEGANVDDMDDFRPGRKACSEQGVKSPLLEATLGEHVFQTFIANKRAEIEEYNTNVSGEFEKQVSDYEVKKYLPFL